MPSVLLPSSSSSPSTYTFTCTLNQIQSMNQRQVPSSVVVLRHFSSSSSSSSNNDNNNNDFAAALGQSTEDPSEGDDSLDSLQATLDSLGEAADDDATTTSINSNDDDDYRDDDDDSVEQYVTKTTDEKFVVQYLEELSPFYSYHQETLLERETEPLLNDFSRIINKRKKQRQRLRRVCRIRRENRRAAAIEQRTKLGEEVYLQRQHNRQLDQQLKQQLLRAPLATPQILVESLGIQSSHPYFAFLLQQATAIGLNPTWNRLEKRRYLKRTLNALSLAGMTADQLKAPRVIDRVAENARIYYATQRFLSQTGDDEFSDSTSSPTTSDWPDDDDLNSNDNTDDIQNDDEDDDDDESITITTRLTKKVETDTHSIAEDDPEFAYDRKAQELLNQNQQQSSQQKQQQQSKSKKFNNPSNRS